MSSTTMRTLFLTVMALGAASATNTTFEKETDALFCGGRLFFRACLAWGNFYDYANGEGWNQCSESRFAPCDCPGVTCEDGEITGIELPANQLAGNIDDTFSTFGSSLKKLDLMSNSLKGLVPDIFEQFEVLEIIDFSDNKLWGELPLSLTRMPALKRLNLEDNNFTGSISPAFGDVSTLRVINLRRNGMSGEIPASLAALDLRYFVLSQNEFSGRIPDIFGKMQKMHYLGLDHNRFEGEIPASIADLEVNSLALECNHLSGLVPDMDWSLYTTSCGLGGPLSTTCNEGYEPNKFACPLPAGASKLCNRCRSPIIHSTETYLCEASCVAA